MIINLYEIPNEGQEWILNRKSGELNSILADLIGDMDYEARVFVRALQPGTYDLTGSIKTQLPEECSRCGLDFKFPIHESFHELMIPASALPRDGKYTKANHYSDENHAGPSVVEYEGHHFNAGEYLHEVVGLASPYNPAPEADENGACRLCKIPLNNRSFGYEEEMPEVESPFAALKKLKI